MVNDFSCHCEGVAVPSHAGCRPTDAISRFSENRCVPASLSCAGEMTAPPLAARNDSAGDGCAAIGTPQQDALAETGIPSHNHQE